MPPTRLRVHVFALSWLAYASYYIGRKQFAVSKASLASQYHLTTEALGRIDTGYLVAYSLGMFASGWLCDRVGPRRLLGAGMLASAAAVAWFGASSAEMWFAVAFTVNGLAQSTGWPGTIKAMAPWWSAGERGKIMGWWSTCYQVGGIVATALASALLVHAGWRSAFWVPAVWMALVGLVVLWRLPDSPQAGPPAEGAEKARAHVERRIEIWYLGFIYFGFKLIRYSLLFWLPFYLQRQLGYSAGQAGYLSISFELGGVCGTVASGIVFDRMGARQRAVLFAMTFGLALSLVLYTQVAAWGAVANFAAMAAVGFMLFGPDALISGAMAQELGGAEGAGSASGIINGIGSLGAIAQGTVTAVVATRYGWDRVFHLFIGLAFACAAALLPYALGRRSAKVTPRAAPSREAAPVAR
ncbi:MFS transporter [Pendulispora brunnea]|uniref:MFS transporter n=1 Tax=Pendulispora brunnea TaxID=2905690 RepID=A0ABZ2K1T6_9BACT